MTETNADMEVVMCPGCGGGKWTAEREAGNPTLDPSERFTIVRCDSCGLAFTNPRPKLSALGKYYPKDYSPYQSEESAAAGDGGSIKNLVLRDAFGAPSIRPGAGGTMVARAIECVRRPESFGFGVAWRGSGRLLDFGCGSGKFLRRMHSLGWDVTGIDFSEEAVNVVRKSGLKALVGTLPHAELKPRSFDVVTLRHALEHVPAPREILRLSWELLDAGGLLLIAVPNYDAWEIEKLGEAGMGLDLPRHLTHFTPASLKKMMEGVGLTNVSVRQVSRASWIRKAGKRSKSKSALRNASVARFASTMAQIRGRGNEIIATAEKEGGG